MSSDRTGHALGTLEPVIYFINAAGHILLPPQEIGQGTVTPREMYERRYRAQGYEWREAGTIYEVDKLQSRLVAQETKTAQGQAQYMDEVREKARRETASNLRQRMCSRDCSAFEREFISLWLGMEEEKRKKYTQRWSERVNYLWAREMDAKTTVEDRMGEG
jgi:hypothetical protein